MGSVICYSDARLVRATYEEPKLQDLFENFEVSPRGKERANASLSEGEHLIRKHFAQLESDCGKSHQTPNTSSVR